MPEFSCRQRVTMTYAKRKSHKMAEANSFCTFSVSPYAPDFTSKLEKYLREKESIRPDQ